MAACFIIDGFNLYHSVKQASYDSRKRGKGTRWLDIYSLCESYLHLVKEDEIESVYYFSALAKHITHRAPDTVARHKKLISCLIDTGIIVKLSKFKAKQIKCSNCGFNNTRHEEKETDVAISSKILELSFTDRCETIVVVSGDTDIAPAVRTAKKHFPEKKIVFAFPYKRKNNELGKVADFSFNIGKKQYFRFQFPDPYQNKSGSTINKPTNW